MAGNDNIKGAVEEVIKRAGTPKEITSEGDKVSIFFGDEAIKTDSPVAGVSFSKENPDLASIAGQAEAFKNFMPAGQNIQKDAELDVAAEAERKEPAAVPPLVGAGGGTRPSDILAAGPTSFTEQAKKPAHDASLGV